MNWGWIWKPYESVAAKKQQAARRLAKLKKDGQAVAPVAIAGRKITNSFWGVSWCQNLERYSDYETRLPRGRSYVRNGAVIDLQIDQGQVTATVSGTELYTVKIGIQPVNRERWQAICKDCTGAIDSLVELLQGRIAKSVMDRVCRQGDGLFPAPKEIKLSCSCPDWADMCKHVAAALYGVGARLDEKPELLFVLRGVDHHDLIAGAGQTLAQSPTSLGAEQVLAEGDMAALFGLDMADGAKTAAGSVARRSKKAAAVAPPSSGVGQGRGPAAVPRDTAVGPPPCLPPEGEGAKPPAPFGDKLAGEGRGAAKASRRIVATAAKKTAKKIAKTPTPAATQKPTAAAAKKAAKKVTPRVAAARPSAAKPARKSKTAKAALTPAKTSQAGTDAKPPRAPAKKATPARKTGAKTPAGKTSNRKKPS